MYQVQTLLENVNCFCDECIHYFIWTLSFTWNILKCKCKILLRIFIIYMKKIILFLLFFHIIFLKSIFRMYKLRLFRIKFHSRPWYSISELDTIMSNVKNYIIHQSVCIKNCEKMFWGPNNRSFHVVSVGLII